MPTPLSLKNLPPLFVLYRYFLSAATMRGYFHEQLRDEEYQRTLALRGELGYVAFFLLGPPGIGMAYFYSALYVVAEAWKELGYSDTKIDALLQSPFLDSLRRFRNSTFHFQADFVSDKWAEFLDAGAKSSEWIRSLYDAFAEFFDRKVPTLPEELEAQISGKPFDKKLEIMTAWLQALGTTPKD